MDAHHETVNIAVAMGYSTLTLVACRSLPVTKEASVPYLVNLWALIHLASYWAYEHQHSNWTEPTLDRVHRRLDIARRLSLPS